jgi:hypothetical protein
MCMLMVTFNYLATVPLGKLISIRFILELHSHHGAREGVHKKPNKIVYMSYRLASLARRWCVNQLPPS